MAKKRSRTKRATKALIHSRTAGVVESPQARRRWIPLALFSAAVLVRLVYLLDCRDQPFIEAPIIDAKAYDELAVSISEGERLEPKAFWQPPLYPLFLALIYTKVLQYLLLPVLIVLVPGFLLLKAATAF